MTRHRGRACSVLMLLLVAQWANGQGPERESPQTFPLVELTGAYVYLRDDSYDRFNPGRFDLDEEVPERLGLSGRFELGSLVSMNINLTRSLGVVGEMSASYNSQRVADLGDLEAQDLDSSILGFHGGLRFTHRGDGVATPYVQLLAGATRSSDRLLGRELSETDFSIQPGVGVMFRLSESIRLGLGGDYRLVFTEGTKTNQFRFYAGLVFPLGTAGRASPPAATYLPPPPPLPPPLETVAEPAPMLPVPVETAPAAPVAPPTAPPPTPVRAAPAATDSLSTAQEFLRAGRYPEAADSYHQYLIAQPQSTFTIPVAVYCDVSNLARHVGRVGDTRGLLLVRRPVQGRTCWGLFWGLFASRAEAQAALGQLPPALRTSGQVPRTVSWILAQPY